MVGGNTMINKKFLYFKNLSTFNTSEKSPKSIAFIEDINAVWTHGKFFYCNDGVLSTELAKYATKEEIAAINTALSTETERATKAEGDLSARIDAINVPTKVSELTNDSKFQTDTEVAATVSAEIAKIVNGAPETFDTLKEVADYIEEHKSVETALNEAIGAKADKTALDNYYDKATVDSKIAEGVGNVDLSVYETIEGAAGKYQPKGDYLTEHQSLENYYNKTQVDASVAAVSTRVTALEAIDHSKYLTEHQDISGLATKTALNELAESLEWYEEPAAE